METKFLPPPKFTQLTYLIIESSYSDVCSSTTADGTGVNTDPARAMPKLETLRLGDVPFATGVTGKGQWSSLIIARTSLHFVYVFPHIGTLT